MQESLLRSSIKSLLMTFFGAVGILLAFSFSSLFYSFPYKETQEKNTLTILPNLNGEKKLLPAPSPIILRIDFHGAIGLPDSALNAKNIKSELYDAQNEKWIKRIKAILLHVKTPGGTVDDSEEIREALLAFKKKYNIPIYTYVDGLCASGGIWTTTVSNKIYANSISVIGSIGVIIGPLFNISKTMERFGIESKTLAEGTNKDEGNPFRPWKPDELSSLDKINQALYDHFLNLVSESRPITKEKLLEIGANVFIAKEAKELGLIDEVATYEETLNFITKDANITGPISFIQFKPKPSLFEMLFEKDSLFRGKLKHEVSFYNQKERFSLLDPSLL